MSQPSGVYNLCFRESEHVHIPIRSSTLLPFRLAEVTEPHGPFQQPCVPESLHVLSQDPAPQLNPEKVGWRKAGFGQMEEQTEKSKLHTSCGMRPAFPAALQELLSVHRPVSTVSAFGPRRWLSQELARLWRWACPFAFLSGSPASWRITRCWQVRFHLSGELALFLLFHKWQVKSQLLTPEARWESQKEKLIGIRIRQRRIPGTVSKPGGK